MEGNRNYGMFGMDTDEPTSGKSKRTKSKRGLFRSKKATVEQQVNNETAYSYSDQPARDVRRASYTVHTDPTNGHTVKTLDLGDPYRFPEYDYDKQLDDAARQYNKATKGAKARICNAAAIILGVATAGLAGFAYATKSIAYQKAVATATYNAQIIEAQKSAVEALHQSAVNALNTGNPLFDYNDFGHTIFPNMSGKFSAFAEANPEIAQKIVERAHSHSNIDVLNQYAQDRGFADYSEFQQWTMTQFGDLFAQNGTISPDATMSDIDAYYYTFVDLYNYLGDEAVSFYSDDILKAGIDPASLQGVEIITDPFTDASGNVINEWTMQLAPDAVDAMSNISLDSSEIVGTIGIAAMAGLGGYFVASKIGEKLSAKSAQNAESQNK